MNPHFTILEAGAMIVILMEKKKKVDTRAFLKKCKEGI